MVALLRAIAILAVAISLSVVVIALMSARPPAASDSGLTPEAAITFSGRNHEIQLDGRITKHGLILNWLPTTGIKVDDYRLMRCAATEPCTDDLSQWSQIAEIPAARAPTQPPYYQYVDHFVVPPTQRFYFVVGVTTDADGTGHTYMSNTISISNP